MVYLDVMVEAMIGIAAGLLLTAVVLGIVLQREKRRSTALAAAAGSLGMVFKRRSSLDDLLPLAAALSLFSTGYAREIKNLLRGQQAGVMVEIFDCGYLTGLGRPRPSWQTVIKVNSGKLRLPAFELCPETAFSRLVDALGFHDINLDAYPRFSNEYQLLGSDEEAVRRTFTPNLVHYFESHLGLCVEGEGGGLICYRDGIRVRPDEIRRFMNDGMALYREFLG